MWFSTSCATPIYLPYGKPTGALHKAARPNLFFFGAFLLGVEAHDKAILVGVEIPNHDDADFICQTKARPWFCLLKHQAYRGTSTHPSFIANLALARILLGISSSLAVASRLCCVIHMRHPMDSLNHINSLFVCTIPQRLQLRVVLFPCTLFAETLNWISALSTRVFLCIPKIDYFLRLPLSMNISSRINFLFMCVIQQTYLVNIFIISGSLQCIQTNLRGVLGSYESICKW